MEELIIKQGPFKVARRVIGVINIICAVAMLLTKLGAVRFFDWIFFIVFMISGVSLLTDGFGTEKIFFKVSDGFLRIKWMNRIRTFVIPESEIERITLTKYKVVISAKENKGSVFKLDFLESEQKKEVYNFMIEYSKEKNLELINDIRG